MTIWMRVGHPTALYVAVSVFFCFPHDVAFSDCYDLYAFVVMLAMSLSVVYKVGVKCDS